MQSDNPKDLERIDNWEDFERLVGRKAYGPPSQVASFFRGQADFSQPLQPSLLRRIPRELMKRPQNELRRLVLDTEEYLSRQFMSQAELHAHSIEISDRRDTLAWWAVMQHYGAPSRLLDWTLSPHVALYFAVEKNFDKPGAIWLLDFYRLHSAMRKLSPKDIAEMSMDEARTCLKKMQEQSCIFVYERIRKAARMVAQQHAFTLATDVLLDYEKVLASGPEGPYARKISVPAELKKQFLYRLWRMNITANSLFPGLEGLGRHTGELTTLEFAAAVGQVGSMAV